MIKLELTVRQHKEETHPFIGDTELPKSVVITDYLHHSIFSSFFPIAFQSQQNTNDMLTEIKLHNTDSQCNGLHYIGLNCTVLIIACFKFVSHMKMCIILPRKDKCPKGI